MKTKTIGLEKLVGAINPNCKGVQTPLFIRDLAFNMDKVLKLEITNSQSNRVAQLVTYLTKGYEGKEINFHLLNSIIVAFINKTNGMNKDQIKCVFRSFIKVPKYPDTDSRHFRQGRSIKGLNTEIKWRDYWGAESILNEVLKNKDELYKDYLNLLTVIRKMKGVK